MKGRPDGYDERTFEIDVAPPKLVEPQIVRASSAIVSIALVRRLSPPRERASCRSGTPGGLIAWITAAECGWGRLFPMSDHGALASDQAVRIKPRPRANLMKWLRAAVAETPKGSLGATPEADAFAIHEDNPVSRFKAYPLPFEPFGF